MDGKGGGGKEGGGRHFMGTRMGRYAYTMVARGPYFRSRFSLGKSRVVTRCRLIKALRTFPVVL